MEAIKVISREVISISAIILRFGETSCCAHFNRVFQYIKGSSRFIGVRRSLLPGTECVAIENSTVTVNTNLL